MPLVVCPVTSREPRSKRWLNKNLYLKAPPMFFGGLFVYIISSSLRPRNGGGGNLCLSSEVRHSTSPLVDISLFFYDNQYMPSFLKSNKPSLLVPILILFFLVTLFLFIRRFFTNKTSPSSLPLFADQVEELPLQNFEASLVCLPPDQKPPCAFGLLYQQKKYRISGLSQASLIAADFQHGQNLTISGKIEADQIVISSLSGN